MKALKCLSGRPAHTKRLLTTCLTSALLLAPVPAAHAAAPPEKIVFGSDRLRGNHNFNTYDIFLMNDDGSQQQLLIDTGGNDIEPAISPDGTKVAFSSANYNVDGSGQEGFYDIYVVNIDGSNLQRLTHGIAEESHPSWSPDGSKIVFSRGNVGSGTGGTDIFIMNADGTGQTFLTHVGGPSDSAMLPAWSPAGDKILFSYEKINSDENQQIYVVNVDGSNLHAISPPNLNCFGAAWSADGSRIVTTARPQALSLYFNIYVMDADGSNGKFLTNNGNSGYPYFERDGHILFTSWSEAPSARLEIYKMDAEGSNVTQLTTDPFSSDGGWGGAKIRLNAGNQAPVAVGGSATTNENTPVNVTLSASDADADALTYKLVAAPTRGTLSGSGANRTYTPTPGYSGSDSLTFKVTDPRGAISKAATINITVQAAEPVNTVPVANADTLTVDAGSGATTVDVLNNDSDADGDILTVAAVTQPSNGTTTLINGIVRYTPAGTFSGTDNFTYTVSDGQGGTDTAIVTVTVQTPNSTSGGKISGNGQTSLDTNSVSAAAKAGDTDAVSFNFSASNSRKGLSGKLRVRDGLNSRTIEATQLTALMVNGKSARLYGTASVNGSGAYSFVLEVTDASKKGIGADTLSLELSNGISLAGTLQKGNITVQQK